MKTFEIDNNLWKILSKGGAMWWPDFEHEELIVNEGEIVEVKNKLNDGTIDEKATFECTVTQIRPGASKGYWYRLLKN